MKILVFSDSHNNSQSIIDAIKMHNGRCDLALFLGDGLSDVEYAKAHFPQIPFFCVRGNCDFFEKNAPDEAVLDLDGIKVLICHGHKYNVKYGYERIIYAAREKEADAVFFGHTHIPLDTCEYVDGKRIQLFNPGSVGTRASYGVVNTANGVLVTGIAYLNN